MSRPHQRTLGGSGGPGSAGHWEGDLLFGKAMSPIGTLVERSTGSSRSTLETVG